ncbi:hypothetical protein ABR39_00675, partial [Enterobacter genomosp. O]|uniref:RHS repeat-associated core domain-containing protein n=1 Tax=Enterobacter genomosp. O TaxID=2364150 RepID=UPI00064356B6
ALAWNARNELQAVTPVVRDGDRDDRESYRYGAQSQRVLKVSVQKTGSGVQTRRVVYLPGLELRSTHRGDAETERLQVMTAGEAGRAQVRVLHWTSGRPDGISNDQVRYSHDNLTGSSGLEVDGDGRVISMEEYYPYGGTAVWTARSAAEADYRTVRHSGKERDATGLYYYGYRYCQPWSGRWLSADPAGTVDGLNLFRMCRNNPVTYTDPDGRNPVNKDTFESQRIGPDYELTHRGLDQIANANEKFGTVLRKALEIASDMVKTASVRFRTEQGRNFVQRWLSAGELETGHMQSVIDDLTTKLENMSSAIDTYHLGEKQGNIVGFRAAPSDNTVAFTIPNDPENRIYINMNTPTGSSAHIVQTLIHEFSHPFMGTKDYWYLPVYQDEIEGIINQTDVEALEEFALTTSYSQQELMTGYNWNIPEDWLGNIPVTDGIATRLRTDTQFRIESTLDNADSVTALVLNGNRRLFASRVSILNHSVREN